MNLATFLVHSYCLRDHFILLDTCTKCLTNSHEVYTISQTKKWMKSLSSCVFVIWLLWALRDSVDLFCAVFFLCFDFLFWRFIQKTNKSKEIVIWQWSGCWNHKRVLHAALESWELSRKLQQFNDCHLRLCYCIINTHRVRLWHERAPIKRLPNVSW